MLYLKLQIEDKQISVSLPQSHSELTLNQFLQLRTLKEPTDITDMLSILMQLDKETILQIDSNDIDTFVLNNLSWLNNPEYTYTFPLPLTAKINNQFYTIPDLNKATFGQKLEFQNVFNQAIQDKKTEIDIYTELLCIYFYPLVSNSKFSDSYMSIQDHVLAMSVAEAIPIASFFLLNSTQSLKKNPKNSKQTTVLKRFKLALMRPLTSMVHSIPFTTLHRAMSYYSNRYLRQIMTRYSLLLNIKQTQPGIKRD